MFSGDGRCCLQLFGGIACMAHELIRCNSLIGVNGFLQLFRRPTTRNGWGQQFKSEPGPIFFIRIQMTNIVATDSDGKPSAFGKIEGGKQLPDPAHG